MRLVELPAGQVVLLATRAILVGCGDGLARDWSAAKLRPKGPDVILFTDGSARQISGLYGLLDAMREAGRHQLVRIITPLTDDRVAPLLGAYLQSESSGFPVEVDAELPGAELQLGAVRITLGYSPLGVTYTLRGMDRTLEFHPGLDT